MAIKREKIDKQELYKLYIEQNLSMFRISQIYNCSESFVKTNLDYYDIPIKTCSDYVQLTLSKKQLTKEYVIKNKPMLQIAKEYNTGYTNIQTLLKKYNITKRESHKFKKGKNNPLWKGGEIIPASLFYEYKHGAIRRNMLFDITLQDIEDLYKQQNGICAISGVKLKISACRNKAKESTASLDRIDSSKGYTKDNIQWVHKVVNNMKWDFDQNEFIRWCHVISDHQKDHHEGI